MGQPHRRIALPLLVGAIAAVVLGWAAAKLNVAGYAPVGLLPLTIGVMLGMVLTRAASIASADAIYRKFLVVAAIGCALLAVLAEHTWLYLDFCRQWRDARAEQANVAMFRPETPWSPAEYLHHEAMPGRVALWCIDAMLVIGATVAAMMMMMGRRTAAGSASPATRPT
jgi:hypothetical protein